MLRELKDLGRETAVYGLSTVVGRLLNFLLLPLYTHCLAPADYGVVATVFSYIAFLNVLYGYGMDFSYLRHAGATPGKSAEFSAAFWSLAASSCIWSLVLHMGAGPISHLAQIPSELVRYSAWILACDALALVPFAALRLQHRARRYAGIKIANIVINITLNYVFLVRLHWGVHGVLLASLIASAATLLLLAPTIAAQLESHFERATWKTLLHFALPLVPAGLASMAVQVIDRPILKFLSDDATVGLYQANYRLGIIMMMAVNMFDAAWRPFFIQRAQQENAPRLFGRVMTYFCLGGLALLLFVSLFIADLVRVPLLAGRPLIHPAYWPGLAIVPVVTLGYLFNGIYINLLAPVTLAKRTELVATSTGLGALVNVAANFLLIPAWGMMGAAAATLAAYVAMSVSLYFFGRTLYRVDYEWNRLSHLSAVGGIL